jgi:2-methylcitrate dehydratase PrpD
MTQAQQEPASPQPFVSERLARWAAQMLPAQVPQDVRTHAKLCLLDAIGIALASTSFDFADRAAAGIRSLAGDGNSPVIGMPFRLPLRDAILLNGILVHGLDFDDTHAGSVVHCTASAWPVVLANALARDASGADALCAYVVAVEIDARLGALAEGRFQQLGHHPTGMVAAFGATVAAGRLAGLSAEQLARAQGIVLSMASGSLEFLHEGDWTKRMHPGWAGVCGTTAAALAQSGFIGPLRAYEGRYGLYNLHLGSGHGLDPTSLGRDLGEHWELPDVAFKPYPACHFNHAFADAVLALREEHGDIRAEEVERITVRLHPRQVDVVCEPAANKRRPRNAYDAQFSLPYLVAATLVRGRFTLSELEPEAYTDAGLLAVAERVDYEIDPDSGYPAHYSGEVSIVLRDGRTLRRRQAVNRGARENPISEDDVRRKFFDNAQRAVSRSAAERICRLVIAIDDQPSLDELAAALAPC